MGFGFVLAMLAAIALITWRSTHGILTTAELVARSQETLETIEKVRRHLMETESERRGFLIDGEERHLRSYAEAEAELVRNFTALKQLTETTPEQSERIQAIKPLIDESLRLQHAEIQARQTSGADGASTLFKHAASDKVTKAICGVMSQVELSERERLSDRADLTQRIGEWTERVVFIGTALTLAALVAAGSMILRDIAARRRAEEALADQHNLLSSIIDTMPDPVFVKDVKGRYVMDNKAHREFLHLEENDTIEGKTVFNFFPEALASARNADDQQVLETGKPLRNREEPGLPNGAANTWLSTTRVPLREPGGRILGLVCVSADITERKEAEEKLRSFAAQLERSNAELQSFASVASHDLQESLRKIQAFGDRLKAKCSEGLGDLGRVYLDRMQNAASRMQSLIQDLLKLSRITSRGAPFAQCDLNTILHEVLSDLEVVIEQTGAKIDACPLPVIDADPVQMRQLFQNLISNALKFQKAGIRPEVKITCRIINATTPAGATGPTGSEIAEITVQDNGIGFESKFAEQIFVVFQRLHSRAEYEGTGIGLAVCRKITDRHGGNIMATSSEGHGATFVVALPVHQLLEPIHEQQNHADHYPNGG